MTLRYPPVHAVFGVSPHGILAVLGVLVGAALLLRTVRRRGGDAAAVERCILWAVPVAIVGARVDYVVSHPSQFGSVVDLVAVWRGGVALFGGLISGLVVGAVLARWSGWHLARLLDAAAAPIAIAIAIGRVGDVLLLDHLGKPAGGAWALAYHIRPGILLAPGFGPSPAVAPGAGHSCAQLGQFYAGCSYHLTAGYDLLGSLILLRCVKDLGHFPGC